MTAQSRIRIDIVSDVVCPWCVIGHGQLQKALEQTGIEADIYWHPFELNPTMGADGQDIGEHLAEKYGSTPADSQRVRARIAALGEALGFTFDWREGHRIYNTFAAHQLAHWANAQGQGPALSAALFKAYFSEGRDVSDPATLCDIAAEAGLDRDAAEAVLSSGEFADMVRQKERFWVERGISSVPSMIFQSRHLVTGAQGEDNYVKLLRHLQEAPAETA